MRTLLLIIITSLAFMSMVTALTTWNSRLGAFFSLLFYTSIFFTIPYDKGWSAYQDGKKLEIKQAQTGFMKVDVPKGKGTITLSFIPNEIKKIGQEIGQSFSVLDKFRL